ncbi:MAG: WG repeat-containing protein [Candidatus Melainabacteria bacterium]|nr:WG repeat-containing protein [Candidatus Melainabacteria bacterium]
MFNFKLPLTTLTMFTIALLPAMALPNAAVPLKTDSLPPGWQPEEREDRRESTQKQPQKAATPNLKALNKAIRLKPTAEAYEKRGQYFLKNWGPESAVTDFTKQIKLRPTGRAYELRGLAYESMAVKTTYGSEFGVKAMAAQRVRVQNYSKAAIEDFNIALRLDPKLVVSARERIQCASKIGDNAGAESYLNYFAEHFPEQAAEVYIEQGKLCSYSEGRWKAISYLTKAISLQPQNLKAYMERARVFQSLECHKESIADLSLIIRRARKWAKAYNLRGQEKELTGDFKGAIADFLKAYQLDNSRAGAEEYGTEGFGCGQPRTNLKYAYINQKGEIIGNKFFDEAENFSDGLAIIRKGNFYGYMNKSLSTVIEPRFIMVTDFKNGLAKVEELTDSAKRRIQSVKPGSAFCWTSNESRSLIIDRSGKSQEAETSDRHTTCATSEKETLIEARQFGAEFPEGLAPELIGCRYGYIDESGSVVIPPLFKEAMPFSDGLALIRMGEKYGYIDKLGNFIIEPQFDLAGNFCNGLAPALNLAHGPYADNTDIWSPGHPLPVVNGKKTDMKEYPTFMDRWQKRVNKVLDDATFGFIDKRGKFAVEPKFEIPDYLRTKVLDSGSQYKDKRGIERYRAILSASIFESCFGFHNGLAMVVRDGSFGFIDSSGKVAIAHKFEQADHFQEGLATVKINGKYGYINTRGEIVIEPKFDSAKPFCEGVAIVGINPSKDSPKTLKVSSSRN